MKLFVGIATAGRNAILAHAIESVRSQELWPEQLVICAPEDGDGDPECGPGPFPVVVLRAPKGSCSQRNAIIDHLHGQTGVLLIMDDDFILHRAYLRILMRFMQSNPDVAMANGALAADGIIGPGLDVAWAKQCLEYVTQPPEDCIQARECPSIYGCNMAINLATIGATRFDENLPLYGWQEDVDFSARLGERGRLVKTNIVAGIHLGVKLGRTPGLKLGYSQVINPAYLMRKGTMSAKHALLLIGRNVAMNVVRSVYPEPYIDRRGRLKGNIRALARLMRGQLDPQHVTKIGD